MRNTEYFGADGSVGAVKGLATVAMLKANFDEGRDRLAMFEPFIRDAVATFPAGDMSTEEVRTAIDLRHGLKLPEDATRTLLSRIVRQGFLIRHGGRYFRTDKSLSSEDVLIARRAAEARQQELALALIGSASDRQIEIASSDEALASIMAFMEAYHVRLAFEEPPDFNGVEGSEEVISPQRMATAMFLRDEVLQHGEFSGVVQEILEGFVLQNALLLRDLSHAARRFKDVEAILDSQILFGAIGLRGLTVETATRELLQLLAQTGATVSAFAPTLDEMRRVLAVYEEKIGTGNGRKELYPSDLTRHLLDEAATPADVRQHAALLEDSLHGLGIAIHIPPTRIEKWTSDEEELAKTLADETRRENEPRVVHDVDCVAGVLTLRRGRVARSLDTCGPIFVTNSGMTVGAVQHWYKLEGRSGVPPIIHEFSLSNYAWLKQPESAANLKVHELVALCAGALRPTRQVWERFVVHLRKLESSNRISSDEAAAVVASAFTASTLLEAGIDEDSDAESLSEVVERVRRQDSAEAAAAVERANRESRLKGAELQRTQLRVVARARTVAKAITRSVFGVLVTACMAGAVLSVVDAVSAATPPLSATVIAIVLGTLGALFGFHLKAAARKTEAWLTAGIVGWMLDERPLVDPPRDPTP
jgi:hypothetical protein